jgi:hypothetical protein
MLDMFQAVPPPINRSSKTVYTSSGTCQNLLLPATIVEDLELNDAQFGTPFKQNLI